MELSLSLSRWYRYLRAIFFERQKERITTNHDHFMAIRMKSFRISMLPAEKIVEEY